VLRQAHPEPGIAQGYWVDTRFHSHDRTLGDRPGVVQDLSALQGHTKPLKGSGLVRVRYRDGWNYRTCRIEDVFGELDRFTSESMDRPRRGIVPSARLAKEECEAL